ncbi:Bis(5'-nucleosyl)-tetraphosphatase, symmetrical [compost metagenome]
MLADDRNVLLEWLRLQKLVHVDRELGWMMFHAGLAPKWTVALAEKHAREVEQQLHGNGYRKLFRNMYGDKPAWSPGLSGYDRSRAIINMFTRMRYCTPSGRISMEDKGTPGTQAQGMYPWFEVPGRVERELKMVCGHWSALGLTITQGVHAIDTGAVWGGKLTALQLDSEDLRVVQVPGRDVPAPVPGAQPPRKPQAAPQPERRAEPRSEGGNNERGEQRRRPRRHRPRGNGNGNGNPGGNQNKPAPTE